MSDSKEPDYSEEFCFEVDVYELETTYQKLLDVLSQDYPSGGCCHIVVDDGNLKDSDINFCLKLLDETVEAPEWSIHLQRSILHILLSFEENSAERLYITTGEHP
jgi:hypothetical protein